MICIGSQGIHTQNFPRNSDLFFIECNSLDNLTYKSIISALENLKTNVPRKSYDILSFLSMDDFKVPDYIEIPPGNLGIPPKHLGNCP